MSADHDKAFEFIPAPTVPLTFRQFFEQRWGHLSGQSFWYNAGERTELGFVRLGNTFAEYADYLAAFMISRATAPAPKLDLEDDDVFLARVERVLGLTRLK